MDNNAEEELAAALMALKMMYEELEQVDEYNI